MGRRHAVLCFLAFALAVAVAACGGDGAPSAQVGPGSPTTAPATSTVPAPTTTTAPDYISFIATVKPSVASIGVFPAPDAPEPGQEFPNPWFCRGRRSRDCGPAGVPREESAPRRLGGGAAPRAPERQLGLGARGRDHADAQSLPRSSCRSAQHTITVTNADAVTYTGPVAVGAPETPTPVGTFYLYVLLQAPDPSGPYGPFAYGLSSHSDVLTTFAGGDAEIGIHGNNDASALGHDVSHGCIRMDNTAITELAGQLPLGTPVDVNA